MNYSNNKGFTLIELMVVITVFSITMLVVVDMFVLVTRAQRRVSEQQALTSDTRFVLDSMTRKIHAGVLDYEFYSDIGINLTNPTYVLAVRDQDNNQTVYRRTGSGTGDNIETCSVTASDVDQGKCADPSPSPGDWQVINTDKTVVKHFLLYVRPTARPFELLADNSGQYAGGNIQPRATIVFHAQNRPLTPTSAIHDAYLQTTVTSRIYRR